MEEKKAKSVRMEAGKTKEEGYQKLSYDQLNAACNQLFQQNQVLKEQLKQANMTNMFKRLDYLFLVLQNANVIKDSEFINSCIEEIKTAITPGEDNNKELEAKSSEK